MILPDDIRTRAAKKVQAHLGAILAGEDVAFDVPLHPPTGAAILASEDVAAEFVRAWEGNPHVQWESRNLARYGLGTQQLPARFTVSTNQELVTAACLNSEVMQLLDSLDALCALAPGTPASESRRALIAQLSLWRSLSTDDLTHALNVTRWFVANPNSGVLPRAVAVDGVHGKWLEQHRPLIEHLVAIANGDYSGTRADLGLSTADPTIRLRFAAGCGPAGLDDIAVPISLLPRALSGSGQGFARVLFLENLQTFLSLSPTPDTCLVFGGGYRANAASALQAFEGMEFYYWGDLDVDGYRILDAVRAHRPDARSILMDPATVFETLPLATADTAFRPVTLTRLTAEEATALDLLITHGHLRIEQERINFASANESLAAAELTRA